MDLNTFRDNRIVRTVMAAAKHSYYNSVREQWSNVIHVDPKGNLLASDTIQAVTAPADVNILPGVYRPDGTAMTDRPFNTSAILGISEHQRGTFGRKNACKLLRDALRKIKIENELKRWADRGRRNLAIHQAESKCDGLMGVALKEAKRHLQHVKFTTQVALPRYSTSARILFSENGLSDRMSPARVWVAIRQAQDNHHLWWDTSTAAQSFEDCEVKSLETNFAIPQWADQNPVIKIQCCLLTPTDV